MESDSSKSIHLLVGVFICLLWTVSSLAQQTLNTPDVPEKFNLDMQTAARLRPQLMAQSIAASGRYATGRLVFERLVEQVHVLSALKIVWQLRIVEDDQLNAYSSPDGTVYVESGLAQLAGPSTGLWAAILSHEIAHVVRRDWARRYLFQKSLESGSGATIVLGDPGLPTSSWADSKKSSQDMAGFCRQLEIAADLEGLMLMARAGYHPDFVPALHHLLHAQGSGAKSASLYAMHPCWEARDRELEHAFVTASIDFGHRWPESYASPGGNPPTVVFAEDPIIRKTAGKEWQIQIPMRCQNLAGAVEVVLRANARGGEVARLEQLPESGEAAESELRQLTGCTSPKTTITFTLSDTQDRTTAWTDVYVLDAWGSVLSRADLPKLPH